MVVLGVIIAVVVVAGFVFLLNRSYFGNTSRVDRLRRADPEAALRADEQRAEEGLRGMGRRF